MRQSSRLFFEVLHRVRQDKHNAMFLLRYGSLVGMDNALRQHSEDLNIAGNLRDYWKCLNSGQEVS